MNYDFCTKFNKYTRLNQINFNPQPTNYYMIASDLGKSANQ